MSIEVVRRFFKSHGIENRVQEFDVSSATVELAAEALNCEPCRIAKTLSFMVDRRPVLVVAAGDAKIDNPKYKAQFGTKAKMLSPDQVLELIGHGVGGEADKGHDAADEEVALGKLKQFLRCPTAHQTVVGVVVDGLCPKCVHQLVEHQGGVLLEEGVGCTRVAHTVYYVGA